MPFKSKSQMRAFFAKEKRGELPKGTAERWAEETPNISALPERVKKAVYDSFVKIAKRLFNPSKSPPIPVHTQQKDIIEQARADKMKGMTPAEYRNELTMRRTGTIARNRRSAKSA